MAKTNTPLLAFNRGIISPLALARVDLERLQLSAEDQTNWMPRVLGSMMLRPGFAWVGQRRVNSQTISIPFVFAADDLAEIELTENTLRIWVGEVLEARLSVSSAVTNQDFTTNLTGWTDNDEVGAVSSWAVGGYMQLLGTGLVAAKRYQTVTVAAGDQNVKHALRIVVERGPAVLTVGTAVGDDSYVNATLKTGVHSIAFTPTGNFTIEFSNLLLRSLLVDSCQVEAVGNLELPTPWAVSDLQGIRHAQSADVVFVTSLDIQQRRIERRPNGSWSLVLFEPDDGPFLPINIDPTTIASTALTGDVTLTASRNLFKSGHVGALFRLTSSGQVVFSSLTAENTFTDSILVTGIGTGRDFSISVAGIWVATVTLQRSTDDATWVDIESYTVNTSKNFSDGADNVAYFYRIGVKTGGFTSGTVEASLNFNGGSLTGVVRVTAVASALSASATVLDTLGGTEATDAWFEGEWSTLRGFPTALALYEGRLFFAGKSKVWGSVSDGFESFDDEVIGDSGPISRVIGEGPVDTIHWLAPVQRLLLGTTLSEISARSTSFDEPLTPTNFNLKNADTQGAAGVPPVIDGTRVLYVQRSTNKIYQLQYTLDTNDYGAVDLSELAPEIGEPGILRVAVQRQPDTRIHCVRSDGKVAVLVKDTAENTLAWILVETDGIVEDAYVLPGVIEDQVYYTVQRTVGGSTVRYREKWALESEARGGTTNKIADSFVYYSGVATSTITGLIHIEGESVVIWGNGKDLGTATVSGGQITVSEPVTTACVGLAYTGTFKSAKLAYAASMGTALGQKKKVNQIGVIARDMHPDGLQFGPSLAQLYDLPKYNEGALVDPDTVHLDFDSETFPFGGQWDTDSRLLMQAQAPKPVTVLAAIVGLETHDKS